MEGGDGKRRDGEGGTKIISNYSVAFPNVSAVLGIVCETSLVKKYIGFACLLEISTTYYIECILPLDSMLTRSNLLQLLLWCSYSRHLDYSQKLNVKYDLMML